MIHYHRGLATERIVRLSLRVLRGPLPRRRVLAAEIGCSERTVRRVLDEIQRHVPVRWQHQEEP